MKKHLIKLLAILVIFFTVSFSASAQIYVTIRPPVPVIVRPPQPSQTYIWVDEDWEPRGKTYRYSGGHWVNPPHQSYKWNPGHWKHHKRGNIWVRGNWKKGK